MSESSPIRNLVQDKLAGRKIDPVGFIDKLLELAREVGEIRCGLAGERTLWFEVVGQTCEIELDAARAKLRMLCARLSVLCNDAKESSVSPYGGEGWITSPVAPLDQWIVRFKNTPGEQEFTVTAVSKRVPNRGVEKERLAPSPRGIS